MIMNLISYFPSMFINYSNPLNWIISTLLLTCLIQSISFLISHYLQIDLFIDLAGSVNFFILALIGLLGCHRHLPSTPFRSLLLFFMISLWAVRLGSFQFMRLWNKKKDGRFDAIRGDIIKFAGFWALQAAWIFIVSLPFTLVNAAATSSKFVPRGFGFFDVIGFLIWAFGFYFEIRADHEKYLFSLVPRNERTLPFITTGMWSFSRHPNYFGEIVLWFGFWISAAQGIRSWSLLVALFAFISPAFTFYLLTAVSGIPVAEAHDDRKYSKLIAYQQYKLITSPLMPVNPHVYAYLHPRIKKSFFLDRNNVPMPNQAPKMKPGSPIQFSAHSSR